MERPSDTLGGDEDLGKVAAELEVLRGEGTVTAEEVRTLFALSHARCSSWRASTAASGW